MNIHCPHILLFVPLDCLNEVYSVYRSKACTPKSMKKGGTVDSDHTNADDQVFSSMIPSVESKYELL